MEKKMTKAQWKKLETSQAAKGLYPAYNRDGKLVWVTIPSD